MFDHARIRVSDRAAPEHFYTTVCSLLGLETDRGRMFTKT